MNYNDKEARKESKRKILESAGSRERSSVLKLTSSTVEINSTIQNLKEDEGNNTTHIINLEECVKEYQENSC